MYDPQENKLIPVPEDGKLTPQQRDWTKFHEGELISIKGVMFYVHEIGESRMVLKLKK